jgi:hypothetical protein
MNICAQKREQHEWSFENLIFEKLIFMIIVAAGEWNLKDKSWKFGYFSSTFKLKHN